MKSLYLAEASPKEVKKALQDLTDDPATSSVIIALADTALQVSDLSDVFKQTSIPIIGGVFPGIIHHGVTYTTGALIIGLSSEMRVASCALNDNELDLENRLKDLDLSDENSKQGLLVFIDAFAPQKPRIVELLFNRYGLSVDYLGGGAGSLSFESKPCIITNDGIHANYAAIALLNAPISVGVAHGWEAISQPLKVTEADGNMLISLDWKPAFDVYRETVEAHASQSFEDHSFFDLAKSYPFGKAIVQAEPVIRDPIAIDGTAIRLVDEIEAGAFIQIMHGDKTKLLKGAKDAALKASVNESDGSPIFCIDCISRSLFLGNEFEDELKSVATSELISGILTIGEIANTGDSSLEIYNKTIAVARLK